jgi:nicastrin
MDSQCGVLCVVQVCAGWRASGSDDKYLGKCVTATVRYLPSYSTKLECQSCEVPWQAVWKLSTTADAWNEQYSWPADPIWTESDWPLGHPDLQLYLHESSAVENGLLVAGFLVTAAVGAASYAARLAFAKHQAAWNSQM